MEYIQDSLFGKMFPEPSPATREPTSRPSSKPSAGSKTPMLQYLCLKGTDGSLLGASWETVTALPGVSSTLNITEFPSDARESTLSQILDLNAPEKYNLSAKACLGILRRARKRQKELPPMLKEALLETILITGMTMEEIDASTMPDAVGSPDGEDL